MQYRKWFVTATLLASSFVASCGGGDSDFAASNGGLSSVSQSSGGNEGTAGGATPGTATTSVGGNSSSGASSRSDAGGVAGGVTSAGAGGATSAATTGGTSNWGGAANWGGTSANGVTSGGSPTGGASNPSSTALGSATGGTTAATTNATGTSGGVVAASGGNTSSAVTGGAVSSGGAANSGGATAAVLGGSNGTSIGGTLPTGGAASTGGSALATGGVSDTGVAGSSPTGGAVSTGGFSALAAGGTVATGGVSGTSTDSIPVCGDQRCDAAENCALCPADCGACPPVCGDGTCDGGESCASCPADCSACPPSCGDGTCNGAESCDTCLVDCGACAACGDGTCNGTETCGTCMADCGNCPPACGDGACNGSESCESCPGDCGVCVCGDGTCNGSETCKTCPVDCGNCPPACGDGTCNGSESCESCPSDCGPRDAECTAGQTCANCEADCGPCAQNCVNATTLPPFEHSIQYTNYDAWNVTVSGSTRGAADTHSPYCDSSSVAPDRWYQFTAPGTGWCLVDTLGTDTNFPTILAWRPACYLPDSRCNYDAGDNGAQTLMSTGDVVKGRTYYVVVDGRGGAVGDFNLHVQCLSAICGDGICSTNFENCASCEADCGQCAQICGDLICYGTETCDNCSDCGPCLTCGNGACDGSESCSSCPQDCGNCPPQCGDYVCNGTETCDSCPKDCGGCVCGDGACSGSESCDTCPADCGACPYCGDGTCGPGESCANCVSDCGACPVVCGDGRCDSGEQCSSCPADCGSCDGTCLRPLDLTTSSVTGTTSTATNSRSATCVAPDSTDVTYRFVAPVTGSCTASTDNAITQFDTVLEVGATCSSAGQLCNNDVPGSATGSLKSSLDFAATQDRAYLITVDGRSGAKGNYQLDVTCTPGSACGDGLCNDAETCTTCATDCGACGGNCGQAFDMQATNIPWQSKYNTLPEVMRPSACGNGIAQTAAAWMITPSLTSTLHCTAHLAPDNSSFAGAINVVRDCSSSTLACSVFDSGSGTTVTWDAIAATPYYLFVNPKVRGPYTLEVTCEPYHCGDHVCLFETCSTCPADCGACGPVCGDGTCGANEDCRTCPADCHPCNGGDGCALASVLPHGQVAFAGTTKGGTNNGTPTCAPGSAAPDKWYLVRSTVNQTCQAWLSGAGSYAALYVRIGCTGFDLACDARGYLQGLPDQMWTAAAGQSYFVVVDSQQTAAFDYTLNVACN